jgi:nitrogen fixation protein FixH
MTSPNQPANQTEVIADQPKRGFMKLGKHWPLVIVGMLLLHASIIVGTIVVVSSKNDMYVEPDYYAKSVDWDTQRAMLQAAEEMGWVVDIRADSSANKLTVSIMDRNGDPIEGALVEVHCVHPADESTRSQAVLYADGESSYSTKSIAMNQAGFWKTNISIRHRGVHAMLNREVEVVTQ